MITDYIKQWNLDNSEKIKGYQKKYKDKNKELLKEKRKLYMASDPKKHLEAVKKYREANRDKTRAANKKSKIKYFECNWANRTINAAKSRAKRFNIEFSIIREDLGILPECCPILGIKFDFRGRRDNRPSLDRIDNSKGYIKGNVHVISGRANRIKSDATLEELRALSRYFGNDK